MASTWVGAYCNLGHDDDEVCFFDGQFLDSVFIGNSLAFEDDFECVCRHTLGVLDLILEVLDLGEERGTVSEGSTSTWNTSPFRFFTDSFI